MSSKVDDTDRAAYEADFEEWSSQEEGMSEVGEDESMFHDDGGYAELKTPGINCIRGDSEALCKRWALQLSCAQVEQPKAAHYSPQRHLGTYGP
jgi:hypothetical protein